jgi:hypothetical protein
MTIEEVFLHSAINRFKLQKGLGDKTFEQLDEKDIFFKPSNESNSIAVIVQHLNGNMLSRWTNLLTEDGEKDWRDRDAEFEEALSTKEVVVQAWNEGWHCVLNVLENLKPEDVMKTITIRSESLLVIDAIIRQIDHYGNHVGQVVYIGKLMKDEAWQSLSIPKNKSKDFNAAMNHNN